MVSIFAKASICRGNTQVHLRFFCKSKLQSTQKGRAATQMDRSVLQVKFRFMGCLVKANALVLGNIALSLSSQLIVLVFTKQPSAERYLANNFFLPSLRKFQQHIKIRSEKLQTVHKKTSVPKSYVSKVADFHRSNHRIRSVKKVFLERCSQNSQEKACVRDSILIKLHS